MKASNTFLQWRQEGEFVRCSCFSEWRWGDEVRSNCINLTLVLLEIQICCARKPLLCESLDAKSEKLKIIISELVLDFVFCPCL